MRTNELITGVHHGAIVVSDMERSLVFYRDMLKFKVITDKTCSGKEVDDTVGLENVRLRFVVLQVGHGDTLIELLHYLHPLGKPLPPDAKSNDIGVAHIAFSVSDISQVYEQLLQKDVEFNSPPQLYTDVQWTSIYLHDPDGSTLEFTTQPMRNR